MINHIHYCIYSLYTVCYFDPFTVGMFHQVQFDCILSTYYTVVLLGLIIMHPLMLLQPGYYYVHYSLLTFQFDVCIAHVRMHLMGIGTENGS